MLLDEFLYYLKPRNINNENVIKLCEAVVTKCQNTYIEISEDRLRDLLDKLKFDQDSQEGDLFDLVNYTKSFFKQTDCEGLLINPDYIKIFTDFKISEKSHIDNSLFGDIVFLRNTLKNILTPNYLYNSLLCELKCDVQNKISEYLRNNKFSYKDISVDLIKSSCLIITTVSDNDIMIADCVKQLHYGLEVTVRR